MVVFGMLGRVLLICIMGLPWPKAAAAPWTLEEGALYTRASVAREQVEGLSAWRADVYSEYGLTDKLTASFKVEAVGYDDAADFNGQGWRATVRRKIFQSGTFNVTIEGGVLEGDAIGGRNGCETLGAELRGGASWSGNWLKQSTFTFAEAVRREHDGCRRTRYEFGIGQETFDDIWSVTQVWLERGSESADSDKIQSELVWSRGRADYSIGYRNESSGLFSEESIFLAVARQF